MGMETPNPIYREGALKPNPTDSDIYTVLEHRHGGLEVWDCEAFGPWKLVAGPFTGETAYAEASAAYKLLAGESGGTA